MIMDWKPIDDAAKGGQEIVAHDDVTDTRHVTYWTGYGWYDPDYHYYSEAPDFKPTRYFEFDQPTSLSEPPTSAKCIGS